MNTQTRPEQTAAENAAPTTLVSLTTWLQSILAQGELYAGVIVGANGMPTHHLVLMAGSIADVGWRAAMGWAQTLGGELPTRQEQALLFANLKGKFEGRAYWSSEQHAAYADYAWGQGFDYGYQYYGIKSASLRARAVRRLVIS